jgi:hypothetical protein
MTGGDGRRAKPPGIELVLDHTGLFLPPVRAGFAEHGQLVLQADSRFLTGNISLAEILKTMIANESFIYMYLNDDVWNLCNLLLKSELRLLSAQLKEHWTETVAQSFDGLQSKEMVQRFHTAAASAGNEMNQNLLLEHLNEITANRYGAISHDGGHRASEGLDRALEIVDQGTEQSALKVTFGKHEGILTFQDTHIKAVVPVNGDAEMGISDTVPHFTRTITLLERIIPQLGLYYALSQAQIALLRAGWGYGDLKANDIALKDWIRGVTASLMPTKRLPAETTILYFIRATLPNGSEVNGMWPNTLSGDLFYNLESGRIEGYVTEHEHNLELGEGHSFTIAKTDDGGIAVRAVSADIAADPHTTLHFYNDTENSDQGLMLTAKDSLSLLGKMNVPADHFRTAHLRAPKGKEFKFVIRGANNFDIYIVEEGQGGVQIINTIDRSFD